MREGLSSSNSRYEIEVNYTAVMPDVPEIEESGTLRSQLVEQGPGNCGVGCAKDRSVCMQDFQNSKWAVEFFIMHCLGNTTVFWTSLQRVNLGFEALLVLKKPVFVLFRSDEEEEEEEEGEAEEGENQDGEDGGSVWFKLQEGVWIKIMPPV